MPSNMLRKMQGKKGKKAQLMGSEVLLWSYRLFLIAIVAVATFIIVARYNIDVDSRPLIAGQLLQLVYKCKGEKGCIESSLAIKDDSFFFSYDGLEIGNRLLHDYCMLKEKLAEDIFCGQFSFGKKQVLIGMK
jgi:hypothetical protein